MKGALLLPQRCVSELQGQYQIAVVGSDSKVEIRNVKVGERVGSMWMIEDGLKPGERVVSEGVQKARPGSVVRATVVPAEGEAKAAAEKGAAPPGDAGKPEHKEGDAKPEAKKHEAK
jgi:membrane fusion protein (multidrug efflux system)